MIPRLAAKVLLVTPDRETLLFRGGDPGRPEDGTWWFPPGGGVDPGESIPDAARREVRWWCLGDLATTTDTVYPENLVGLIDGELAARHSG